MRQDPRVHSVVLDATLSERLEKPATKAGAESAFMKEVRAAVEEHLGSSSFGVQWLAQEVGLSTRQLQRRLQAETGRTAATFIRDLRLERAAALLETGAVETVREAASAVGYRDPSHFSRLFRDKYGTVPSRYKAKGSG